MAVAGVLLASPRAAQEVLVTGLLRHLQQDEAFHALAKEAEPQSAYRALEAQAVHFAGKLGIVVGEGQSVWDWLPPGNLNSVGLYEAVRSLSDHDLTGLQMLLTVLSFGQGPLDKLDTSDSLFNRVARDLNVDMKNHWRPDAAFFAAA